MYDRAIKLLKEIDSLGYRAYIVGGFPRDKYLGINNNDIDICTNMKIDDAKRYFDITDVTKFGTYKIDNFEITVFRSDIYNDSRYPKIIYVETLKEDLKRRDFIINTLCIDKNGKYIDLFNAKRDLDLKVIRTVKDSDLSFKEDPLRIIRALRFQNDLNFTLSSDIIDSIKANIGLLDTISKTRIEKEINKAKDKKRLMEMINNERKGNKFN